MSQDQHYVPQTYLKWFFNSDELLFRINKSVPTPPKSAKTTGTGGVGYTPDFYVIKDPRQLAHYGLQDPNSIEIHFSRNQEQHYDGLIHQLLHSDGSLPFKVAEDIIQTLLSFKQRNPEFRKTLNNKEALTRIFDLKIKAILDQRDYLEPQLKKVGYTKSFEEFIAALKGRSNSIIDNPDTPANAQNQGILNFMSGQSELINTTANYLLQSAWLLLETSSDQPFITSDNPGFTVDAYEQPHNLNFAEATNFFFPVTPLIALLIGNEDVYIAHQSSQKIIHRASAAPSFVNRLNNYTRRISHKYILGSDENALKQALLDIMDS